MRARAKIAFQSQSAGRYNFRIIRIHRASTDGLIIAAAIRRDATACNSEFRDSSMISRPFLLPEERRDMYTYYARRGYVLCALHARRVSCDPRALKQWRTTAGGKSPWIKIRMFVQRSCRHSSRNPPWNVITDCRAESASRDGTFRLDFSGCHVTRGKRAPV